MNEDIASTVDTRRTTQNADCSLKSNWMKSVFENPFNAFHNRPGCHFTLFVKNNFNMRMSVFMNPVCVIYNLLVCECVISTRPLSVCDSAGQ